MSGSLVADAPFLKRLRRFWLSLLKVNRLRKFKLLLMLLGGCLKAKKSPTKKYSPEVRERAVRMVFEHQNEHTSQWAAIGSIAGKIGCSPETLRAWVRRAERDQGMRGGLSSDERERLKALERENKELRQANEILRKASAYFAQAELDRPRK